VLEKVMLDHASILAFQGGEARKKKRHKRRDLGPGPGVRVLLTPVWESALYYDGKFICRKEAMNLSGGIGNITGLPCDLIFTVCGTEHEIIK